MFQKRDQCRGHTHGLPGRNVHIVNLTAVTLGQVAFLPRQHHTLTQLILLDIHHARRRENFSHLFVSTQVNHVILQLFIFDLAVGGN